MKAEGEQTDSFGKFVKDLIVRTAGQRKIKDVAIEAAKIDDIIRIAYHREENSNEVFEM